MIHPWITLLGGRRFLLTCWCTNALVWLCKSGNISGGELIAGMSLTAAAYIAGNTAQKWQEAKSNDGNP